MGRARHYQDPEHPRPPLGDVWQFLGVADGATIKLHKTNKQYSHPQPTTTPRSQQQQQQPQDQDYIPAL